jgi:MYND finger
MAQQRRHRKSQKHFENLFAAGMSLNDADDKRSAREKLLQAVHAAPLVWSKHRFFTFSEFLATVAACGATQSDIDSIIDDNIIDDFMDKKEEPAHFRAFASWFASRWYTQPGCHMNMNTAAEILRHGLDIVAASPKENEKRQVLHHPYTQLCWHEGSERVRPRNLTLKGILGLLEEKLREQLSICTDVHCIGERLTIAETLLADRMRAGGTVCDCCGKSLEQLQIPSFQRCSRCEMVFYCSPTCQREHWKKKGHKLACRQAGQIEVGDDMFRERTEALLEFAKVVACADKATNRWQVLPSGTNTREIVSGDKLFRLRPPSTL